VREWYLHSWQEDVSKRSFAVLAELFFTASAVVLLFLVYQLWFTTELAKIQHAETSETFLKLLDETAKLDVEAPIAQLIETSEIEGLGLLYIPALSEQVWGLPVVSGVDDRALALGAGHYSKTELPGEIGNFAIAGHRATNGEPFAYFEKLQEGDFVYLQTNVGWFSYQLVADQKIEETEVWVLEDDPIGLGEQRLITLTTCDPRWNSTRRWAWWGVQTSFSTQAPSEVQGDL
jgi:sortase A